MYHGYYSTASRIYIDNLLLFLKLKQQGNKINNNLALLISKFCMSKHTTA